MVEVKISPVGIHYYGLLHSVKPGITGLDVCLLNSSPINQTLEDAYLESRSVPMAWDEEAFAGMGVATFCGDFLAEERFRIRHDPYKLARLILSLTRGIHHTSLQ